MKKKVSTIIVVDNKKFLILQRSPTSTGAGLWNFPGGSIEDGESRDEAAVRELKEEAGLIVKTEDIEYLGTLNTKHIVVSFFITSKYSGEVVLNKESQDYKWITLSETDNYKFVGPNKEIHPDLIFKIGIYIYGE